MAANRAARIAKYVRVFYMIHGRPPMPADLANYFDRPRAKSIPQLRIFNPRGRPCRTK